MQPFGVLISSAGRRVALLGIFKQSIEGLGLQGHVTAADATELSSAVHVSDRAFSVPPCSDPSFLDRILEICLRHEIRLVVPTIDTELAAYAQGRELFRREGVIIAVSGPETIEITQDKRATHAWLVNHGFPTVSQCAIHELGGDSPPWQGPVVAKPRFGSGGIGVEVLAGFDDVRKDAYTDGYVFEELAPGREYSIDVLMASMGTAVCAVPRQRLEVRAGEVSKSVTVRSADLEQLALKVCEALPDAYGAITVQVFFDEPARTIKVIEINPRFGGGFPLSWEAGALYPRWLIEELCGMKSSASGNSWRDGLVMLRYDAAVFVDVKNVNLR